MHGKDDDNGDCMKTYREANKKEEYSFVSESFTINTTSAHILVVYVDQIIVMVSPDRPMRAQEGKVSSSSQHFWQLGGGCSRWWWWLFLPQSPPSSPALHTPHNIKASSDTTLLQIFTLFLRDDYGTSSVKTINREGGLLLNYAKRSFLQFCNTKKCLASKKHFATLHPQFLHSTGLDNWHNRFINQ